MMKIHRLPNSLLIFLSTTISLILILIADAMCQKRPLATLYDYPPRAVSVPPFSLIDSIAVMHEKFQNGNLCRDDTTDLSYLIKRIDGFSESSLDRAIKDYYLAALYFLRGSASDTEIDYQKCTDQIDSTLLNLQLPTDLALSMKLLAGIAYIHWYWSSRDSTELLGEGVQKLREIHRARGVAGEHMVRVKSSAAILDAIAEMERLKISSSNLQNHCRIYDTLLQRLTVEYPNTKMGTIANYLRALILYKKASLVDTVSDKTSLIDSTIAIIRDSTPMIFDDGAAGISDGMFLLQYYSLLLKKSFKHTVSNQDLRNLIALIANTSDSSYAKFNLILVDNLLEKTPYSNPFAPSDASNVHRPEAKLWVRCTSLMNSILNLPVMGVQQGHQLATFFQASRDSIEDFLSDYPNHPLSPIARFLSAEANLYLAFLRSCNLDTDYSVGNEAFLPRIFREVIRDRFNFETLVAGSDLNNLNAQDYTSWASFSPVATLFLFGRYSRELHLPTNPDAYAMLQEILPWIATSTSQDSNRWIAQILDSWAIYKSDGQSQWDRAAESLRRIANTCSVGDILAEQKYALAVLEYRRGNTNTACQILSQLNDSRAREKMHSWCPNEPVRGKPTLYGWVGFQIDQIDNAFVICRGYPRCKDEDISPTSPCRSYRTLFLKLWQNHPVFPPLLSVFPIPQKKLSIKRRETKPDYVQGFPLFKYIDDGITIGGEITVTFLFPRESRSEHQDQIQIEGIDNPSEITDSTVTFALTAYEDYVIRCWLKGYYQLEIKKRFATPTQIRLAKFLITARNWIMDKKSSFLPRGHKKDSAYFVKIDAKRDSVAYIMAEDEHFYVGMVNFRENRFEETLKTQMLSRGVIPSDIAINSEGKILITDMAQDSIHSVLCFDHGEFRPLEIGRLGPLLRHPIDIEIKDGSTFILNAASRCIIGDTMSTAKTSDPYILELPVSKDPMAFITNKTGFLILDWGMPEKLQPTIMSADYLPWDLFIDEGKSLLVTDPALRRVIRYDLVGNQLQEYYITGEFPMCIAGSDDIIFLGCRGQIIAIKQQSNPNYGSLKK